MFLSRLSLLISEHLSTYGVTRSTSAWAMGTILGPNRIKAKEVNSCTYCCNIRCATLILWVGKMPWLKTGATDYCEQLWLLNNGHAIKELVVCNSLDLESLNLLYGLALGCYQLSPCIYYLSSSKLSIPLFCEWLIIMNCKTDKIFRPT